MKPCFSGFEARIRLILVRKAINVTIFNFFEFLLLIFFVLFALSNRELCVTGECYE
jgi:hypothetical protein